jgi:hypothetical protein
MSQEMERLRQAARGDAARLAPEAVSTFLDELSQVTKILCCFRHVGKPATVKSTEVVPAEDGAVRPLTFPGSLLEDPCLGAFAPLRRKGSTPTARKGAKAQSYKR